MLKQTSKMLIISAFRELMEHDKFDSITTSGIIEKSGVSRATFYKHFGDKYDLLESIVREEIIGTCFYEVERSVAERELEVLRCFSQHKKFYAHAFESAYFERFWMEESIKSNRALLVSRGVSDDKELMFTSYVLGSSVAVMEDHYVRGKLPMRERDLAERFGRLAEDQIASALDAQKRQTEI